MSKESYHLTNEHDKTSNLLNEIKKDTLKPCLIEEDGSCINETKRLEKEGETGSTQLSLFAFKKPKLKSASINREFLSKASHPIHHLSNKGGTSTNVHDKRLDVVNTTSIQPGKPRLTTKISSSYTPLGTSYQDGLFSKSFDHKSCGPGRSPRLTQNGLPGTLGTLGTTGTLGGMSSQSASCAPVWGRHKKPLIREYTDDELAAMHGIHLVRRLSATSDDDKAGKWDEMDDDETDWSDTIEFADGTKFALPHEDHTVETADSASVSSWAPVRAVDTPNAVDSADTTTTTTIIPTAKTVITTTPQETQETQNIPEIQEKQISKEERFGEEHYDRSWCSQRPGAPQIYNVNTGKFDIVDHSTKSSKKSGRKGYFEDKLRTGHPISLLSRQSLPDNVKKDEITDTHDQKLYPSTGATGNATKESPTISNNEHRSVSHSAVDILPSITKPNLLQPLPSVDPMFHNIEAFQRAIMIEAKEKARLRREEEEMERKMQQERAKKKAEELAKLAQTSSSKSTEVQNKEENKNNSFISKNQNISSIHSCIVSEDTLSSFPQDSPAQIQDESSKISDPLTEGEKDKSELSDSYIQASEIPSHQTAVNSNKQKADSSVTPSPEIDPQTQPMSKSTLKKTSSM
ncbi:hypothetical protein PCK1_001185 [Pneumocystis canis]|nr:hypothetical protein PCK1_001185 [Pneumocystis canis]